MCERSPCILLAVVLLAASLFLSGCISHWARERPVGGRVAVDGAFLYGPIRGYVQTPAGGHPGTTSTNRPTLKELGIRTAEIVKTTVTIGLGAHAVYGGAQLAGLSGSDTLSQPLLTHHVLFPAGTAVKSTVQLNRYQIGYQYQYVFRHEGGGVLNIDPAIEALLFDFGYSLNGGGNSTDRAYMKAGVRLGVRTEWSPWRRFSLSGEALESVPIPGQPIALTLRAAGQYRLWGRAHQRGTAFLGIVYDRLDHKDLQTVPNHIHVTMGPMLLAGLRLEF